MKQEESFEHFLKEIGGNSEVSVLSYNVIQDSLYILQEGYYDEDALRIGLNEKPFYHNSAKYVYIYSKMDMDTILISVFPQSLFYREVFDKYRVSLIFMCCVWVLLIILFFKLPIHKKNLRMYPDIVFCMIGSIPVCLLLINSIETSSTWSTQGYIMNFYFWYILIYIVTLFLYFLRISFFRILMSILIAMLIFPYLLQIIMYNHINLSQIINTSIMIVILICHLFEMKLYKRYIIMSSN
jgi:hypothetical protein